MTAIRMTSALPDSNGVDTPEERYDRAVRAYNVAVSRYNSALDALEWARREFSDAESWYGQMKDELNRAAGAIDAEGVA